MLYTLSLRLVLWATVLLLALVPALTASRVAPSIHLEAWAWDVNQAGSFRDLLFLAILAPLIGTINLWDNIVRSKAHSYPHFRLMAVAMVAYFVAALAFAALTFWSVPPHQAVNYNSFLIYMAVLATTVVIGVLSEVLVAINQ